MRPERPHKLMIPGASKTLPRNGPRATPNTRSPSLSAPWAWLVEPFLRLLAASVEDLDGLLGVGRLVVADVFEVTEAELGKAILSPAANITGIEENARMAAFT